MQPNISIYKGKNTMDFQYDIKKNIPDTIKAINNTYDINQITYYENQLACMLYSPLMFTSALINLSRLFAHKSVFRIDLLINMMVFLLIGISYEYLRKSKLKVLVASWIITGLSALWFAFVYLRFYHIIGPAVWTIAAIQIVFSMSRLSKNMVVIVGLLTILLCIFSVMDVTSYAYEISLYYLLPQFFLLILLFLILSISHRINKDRYENLYKQYLLVNDQKTDITALYEELVATEDELREQNNQLADYNKRIIAREQKLHSLAYYDALTGLPNRTMFLEHLEQTIKLCTRKSKSFYLVLFDVDSFKMINYTLGFPEGDQYLLFVTDNMKKHLKEEDILSRIDGDEFALIIRRDINETVAATEIEQMKSSFSQPFLFNNSEFRLFASYGISVFPRDGTSSSAMLKKANIALDEAKQSLMPME